jgi:hypothetical protein
MAKAVNYFASLASSDISKIANVVGVNLGIDGKDNDQVVVDVVEKEKDRAIYFVKECHTILEILN